MLSSEDGLVRLATQVRAVYDANAVYEGRDQAVSVVNDHPHIYRSPDGDIAPLSSSTGLYCRGTYLTS